MTDPTRADAHVVVVMGATGDLMRRKLLPVLYRLTTSGNADRCLIVGTGRSQDVTDEQYQEIARDALCEFAGVPREDATEWARARIRYQGMGRGTTSDYKTLGERLDALERESDLPKNRIFYLALPPVAFPKVILGLGEAGLASSGGGWTRLVVEKPFGTDLGSAQSLNDLVHRHFNERQVYRIDHYLGKETVQNLLAFRFGNAIFESLWNRDRIQDVEITVAESLGVEKRAGYYDKSGAVRDMVQNHLTQLLTLTAMEVPARFDADAIRTEKEKVLRSILEIREDDIVLGQYGPGAVEDSELAGYREEPGVPEDSNTETYAAMRFEVNNWRWQGVPFYIRTGKRLERRTSQIVVSFRAPPVSMFGNSSGAVVHSNKLVITLQPDEGFDLYFDTKSPGPEFDLQRQRLEFRYEDVYGRLPGAYETLLLDVMTGDQTLFVHADEVEASWRLYTPVLETEHEIHSYAAGSWGPEAARTLRGCDWHTA